MRKPVIPPPPPGWNKTLRDLGPGRPPTPGESSSIRRRNEIAWALEYERSLIPADMRFPRKGDVYETLEDMTVDYMTSWLGPSTGGGTAILKAGERVLVVQVGPDDAQPIGVYAKAVDYGQLEQRMVPASDRENPKYDGFYFFFKTLDLNRNFRLVQERE